MLAQAPAAAPANELPAPRISSCAGGTSAWGFPHGPGSRCWASATAFALPVTASFMAGPPGTLVGLPTTLFEISVAWGVALFLFLSAAFHWLVAAPCFGRYIAGLEASHNYFGGRSTRCRRR